MPHQHREFAAADSAKDGRLAARRRRRSLQRHLVVFFVPPPSPSFGAILAATDPVAVVALLKSLGASPKLTVLIAGESLLNDGTAIVLFVIFCDAASRVVKDASEIAAFFAQMALAGPVIGFVCGFCLLRALRSVTQHDGGEGPVRQCALTLLGAYLTFFLSENELKSSGVLATVCAAQVVALSLAR